MPALNSLVTEAIDVIVHSSRHDGVPRVNEVVAVEEQQTGDAASAFTITELFRRRTVDGPLEWTGAVPVRCARPLAEAGYDVRELLDTAAGGAFVAGGTA